MFEQEQEHEPSGYQEIIATLEEHGDKVMRNEPSCVLYLAEHKNCVGCPTEIGCCKVAMIGKQSMLTQLWVVTQGTSLTPQKLSSWMEQQSTLVWKIIEAKSVDEVLALTGMPKEDIEARKQRQT